MRRAPALRDGVTVRVRVRVRVPKPNPDPNPRVRVRVPKPNPEPEPNLRDGALAEVVAVAERARDAVPLEEHLLN